jgi:hypothetical protein
MPIKKTIKKILGYFIWETPQWNNKGVSIQISFSRYAYIKPTMCCTWNSMARKEWYDKPYQPLLVCTEKTFFWLWLRITLKSEIKTKF